MLILKRAIFLLLVATLAGCGSKAAAPERPAGSLAADERAATTQPSTRPSDKAELRLDQITPVPVLPASRPTHDDPPPLDALELFARARGELLAGRRFVAIGLLERAILLDGDSYELYYALGEALLGPTRGNTRSLEAFEKAAEIRPDSVEVRVRLARQYLALDQPARAMEHLRLATLSPAYERGGADAVAIDLLLGRVLAQEGYERAAMEQFERVLAQVDPPSPMLRGDPELMFLAAQPEVLHVQIAELAMKRGRTDRAIRALRDAVRREPMRFDLHALLLRTIATTDDQAAFEREMRDVLGRFQASDQSMKLLREVYAGRDRADDLVDDLRRLHRQNPNDRALTLALVDELQERGRRDEAEALLARAARRDPADTEVIRRLVQSLDRRGEVLAAAKWLVESAAAEPGTLRQTSGLWSSLLQVSRKDRLQLVDLREMQVPPEAEAAKWFWVSRLAELWNRQFASREALQKSVDQDRVFPPAYRVLAGAILAREDIDEAKKADQVLELAERAQSKGAVALAYELRAMLRLHEKKVEEALSDLAAAMAHGTPSPELQLTYADALLSAEDITRAEQTLWKLVAEWPTLREPYHKLFTLYVSRRQPQQAVKVIQRWLAADPGSIEARLLQAIVLAQGRQEESAERLLLQLFDEAGDNEEVLGSLQALYLQRGRGDQWIRLLEQQRQKQPGNHAVVQRLVVAYAQLKRFEDAGRVLDEARAAAADQPDVLYVLAHLYTLIGRREVGNETLEQVVKLDPRHAAASNDLGYSWADRGERLDEAERLVRVAVEAEPDNHAFLDSLAWVLYKRGKFAEARKYLEQALAEAVRPDPVVIDHLGDVLYRLDEPEAAQRQWKRAMDLVIRSDSDRDDLRELRLELNRKLAAYEKGEKVRVAPVAGQAVAPATAPAPNPEL